jgi:transcriptional regulator with XRE-family HTH domain
MAKNLRIVQWRKALALTQEELAKKCHTTQQTIAKIEQGSVDPKQSTLEKIADALGCEIVDLFYSRESFASDVNRIIKKLDLDLNQVSPMNLNNLCWRESHIPAFHPFWSEYKVKNNRIYFSKKRSVT